MTTYNDIRLTRDEAERIKWYFANGWPLTIISGVHDPVIVTLDADMDTPSAPVFMGISARGMDTLIKDVSKVDIAPVGARGHVLTVMSGDSIAVSIPIDWYGYDTDDLHPCLNHWHGVWRDKYGYLYKVHEYDGVGDWVDEWVTGIEGDPITWPDGAVYFDVYTPDTPIDTILEGDAEPWDGGVIGYEIGDNLRSLLSAWTNNTKLTKIE